MKLFFSKGLLIFFFFLAQNVGFGQTSVVNQTAPSNNQTASSTTANVNEPVTKLKTSNGRDTIKNRLPDGVLMSTEEYKKWLNNQNVNPNKPE